MSNEINTNQTQAATISEKELFAEFLEMDIVARASMFGEPAGTYKPNESMREPGLEFHMEEYTNDLTDRLARSLTPLEDIDATLEDLEDYVSTLRRVHDDFHWMMLARLAETDDKEQRYEPRMPDEPVITERAA